MPNTQPQTEARIPRPLQRFVSLRPVNSGHAYTAGFDCGLNGANTQNCHFKYFATPGLTKEWERGKADSEAEKQANIKAELSAPVRDAEME